MRVHHRCFTILAAAVLLLASSLAPSPALAQQAPTPPAPGGPFGMSMPEWQGLSCLWGGSLVAMGVFYYRDVLAVAATGVTNPLLLVPLIATGFLGGCSVGANAAPGPLCVFRRSAPYRATRGTP